MATKLGENAGRCKDHRRVTVLDEFDAWGWGELAGSACDDNQIAVSAGVGGFHSPEGGWIHSGWGEARVTASNEFDAWKATTG